MSICFIVGMPGSGKTTLGKKLADHLKWQFKDLDDVIQDMTKLKISEIFELHGEDRFRELEKQALNTIIQSSSKQIVVATGGGAPCFFDNMNRMIQNGVTIFIDTPLKVIANRLQGEEMEKRPLISKMGETDLLKSIEEKYNNRKKFYQLAHHKIKGDESLESISSFLR